jgi:hypothetical protein
MSRQSSNHPLQLQNAERGQDLGRGKPRVADRLVDTGRLALKVAEERAFLIGEASSTGWRTEVSLRAVRIFFTSGPSSSRMSSTVSTGLAPSRIRRWQPRLAGLSMEPRTSKSARFCFKA